MEEEDENIIEYVPKKPEVQKAAALLSYAVLAALAVVTVLVFAGGIGVETWKTISFPITVCYFVLGGIATYLKYGLTEVKEQQEVKNETIQSIQNEAL